MCTPSTSMAAATFRANHHVALRGGTAYWDTCRAVALILVSTCVCARVQDGVDSSLVPTLQLPGHVRTLVHPYPMQTQRLLSV